MNGLPADLGPESKGTGSQRGPVVNLQGILAPVDFSPASQHGLAFAAAVAGKFHSVLHLLYVVEPPVLPEWGYAHIPQREARLRRAAEEKLPQLPAGCGISPELIRSVQVRSGEAADEICQAAAERHCDLIVLASHGLGGPRHAFTGSTAERVVRRASCPVLTVRDQALRKKDTGSPNFDLKRILVTTDFSEESKKAFPYALALARKFEASLIVLYVVAAHLPAELSHIGFVLEERQLLLEARERMPRFRQAELDPHLHVDTLVTSGGPAHEICRAAETQAADLIVMATHGHTGLKHFMLGSVTENVVRHAPCPVLVVREREQEFVKTESG
jgi:nucleotide-binding universal stress UspA family protein